MKQCILCVSVVLFTVSGVSGAAPLNVLGNGGPVENWLLIGPFPVNTIEKDGDTIKKIGGYYHDFLESLGGESAGTPIAEDAKVDFMEEDQRPGVAATMAATTDSTHYVDLRGAYGVGCRIAYAYCTVDSPKDQTVICGFGSNDYGAVWVNGERLFYGRDTSAADPWSYQFDVPLKKGLNHILVKVEDIGGLGWKFILELHPEDSPVLAARKREALVRSFMECTIRPEYGEYYMFTPGAFPKLVWDNPELVKAVIGETPLKTRWFNNDLEEVTVAKDAGRYMAYVEGESDQGMQVRRAMTFYCCPPDWQPWRMDWKVDVTYPVGSPIDETAYAQRKEQVNGWFGDMFSNMLESSQQGVSLMAALAELSATPSVPVQFDSPSIRNADFQLALKRKLLGVESKYPAMQPPRDISDAPARSLRYGTCQEAGMKPGADEALSKVCKEWYGEVQEPFVTLIARHGVIFYHEAAVNPDKPEFTVDSPTWLASITKTLTGLLFAEFIDQGLIQLDDPVGKYLPGFPLEGEKTLTLRNCLDHTSGLKGHGSYGGLSNPWLDNVILNGMEIFQPGTRYQYNGDGLNLAGKVMEVVSGKSIQRLFHDQLFAPLGVKTLRVEDLGGGGMLNAYELGIMGQLLLQKGAYGNKRVFSEAVMQQLLPRDLSETHPLVPTGTEYGVGLTWQDTPKWILEQANLPADTRLFSKQTLGHGSATGCILRADPENDLVVAQVRNQQTPEKDERNFFRLTQVLFDHIAQ